MKYLNYPTGSIIQFSSPKGKVPTSWVACDGSTLNAVKDSKYENIWNLIGTTFGGSGKSSFKVPNMGGRIPVGQVATASGTGINGPVGSWEGATSVTLTSAQSGLNHSHDLTDPGHNHLASGTSHSHNIPVTATTVGAGDFKGSPLYTNTYNYPATGGTSTAYPFSTATPSGTVATASGGLGSISNTEVSTASSSHSNMQPTIYLQYILKI